MAEMGRNRIIKKQGALPPWIELQHSLDNAHNAFRQTLLTTYTTHIVRALVSTRSLHPLPPLETIPIRDEAWEAREHKFHAENIRQINDLVRRMNSLAPAPARRHLVTLEGELTRVRGDMLRMEVWEGIKQRAKEAPLPPSQPPRSIPIPFEHSLQRLKSVASRSLSTLASSGSSGHGVATALTDGGSGGGANAPESSSQASAGSRIGVGLMLGAGVIAVVYYRRRTQNDTEAFIPLPPTRRPEIVASSPVEPRPSLFGIIRIYIIEPVMTFFRFCHLFVLFGPVILTSPMILVGRPQKRPRPGKPVSHEEENWGAVWWYGFLVKQMERAGPSFIKLGQWAASRADLFPASLCDKMAKLHSNGHPHSFHHTKSVIERAFDLKFDDIFEEFGTTPIGCGAIAQVYKARLKPEILGVDVNDEDALSTSVAIKVLHPRVRKVIPRDIAIMSIFANMINAIPGMQWISLPEEVAVFGEMMRSQLDLRVEAANLERFDANFRKRGRRLTFPRPIKLGHAANGEAREESRDVLIEEFEDALPLKYFLRNGGGNFDDMIANIGLDAFLVRMLRMFMMYALILTGNAIARQLHARRSSPVS